MERPSLRRAVTFPVRQLHLDMAPLVGPQPGDTGSGRSHSTGKSRSAPDQASEARRALYLQMPPTSLSRPAPSRSGSPPLRRGRQRTPTFGHVSGTSFTSGVGGRGALESVVTMQAGLWGGGSRAAQADAVY